MARAAKNGYDEGRIVDEMDHEYFYQPKPLDVLRNKEANDNG